MAAIRILEPSGSDGAIQLQNGGEFDHSQDLFFDISNSRLGVGTNTPEETLHVVGNVKIDGNLTAVEYHTKIVSASIIYQSGSTSFGDTADDIHNFTGAAVFNTGLTGSLTSLVDGSPFINAGEGVLVTSGSDGSITIAATHTVEGSTIIGPSEDGSFEDGLFTDLSPVTQTGTIVDRFNEILKSLAPSPAPQITNIDGDQNGQSCRLSYDSSNILSSYIPVGTSTGFAEVNVNSVFKNETSGLNVRKGVFNSSTSITGDVNETTAADIHSSGAVNYPNNSFGDANKGILKLEINGSIAHTIDLNDLFLGEGQPGSGTAQSLNITGSGFTNISELSTATFADGSSLDLFQHRTAKYIVSSDNQRNGWNILKVIHAIGGTSVTTNSVEWLVDSNNDDMTLSNSLFTSLNMLGFHTISGVVYHIGGTAQYSVNVQNAYSNVYTFDNYITFDSSNCLIDQVIMPQINLGTNEDETKELTIVTQANINTNILLNGTISAAINVNHPTKSNIYAGGQEIISGILLYNLSDSSTNLLENFSGEDNRLETGEYIIQSHVTNATNIWDSYESLNDKNGMLVYNQKLIAPRSAVNAGNFTTIINGPLNNANYSGITSGVRTYYRKVQNTSGGSQSDLSIGVNGSGVIVQHGSSYGISGISVTVKIPTTVSDQTTGWLDLSQPFATGQYSTGDGCLQGSFDSTLNATNTMTFGTKFLNDDEYIVIKIECDATFAGHIDSITVNWG
jgi:hypothetical protein